MLFFMSLINLSHLANHNFNTYIMLMILHNEVQFLLSVECNKHDSISYYAILNKIRFGTILKCF